MNALPVTTTSRPDDGRFSAGGRIRSHGHCAAPLIPPHALRAARRTLGRPGEFALVGRRSAEWHAIGWVVTDTGAVALSPSATALVMCLVAAHMGPDRRPRWMSIGDVLNRVGRGCAGPGHRRAVAAQVRRLRAGLERGGIADLVQADRLRGLRLSAYPTAVLWLSADADGDPAHRVRTVSRDAGEVTR